VATTASASTTETTNAATIRAILISASQCQYNRRTPFVSACQGIAFA
jgi:hypothetical protein